MILSIGLFPLFLREETDSWLAWGRNRIPQLHGELFRFDGCRKNGLNHRARQRSTDGLEGREAARVLLNVV